MSEQLTNIKASRRWWSKIKVILFTISIILLSVSYVDSTNSITTIPKVKSIETENSAFTKSNWMISQGANRSIYLANSLGLVSYNGSTWSYNQMPNSKMLRAITAGSDNKVFVGSFGEFGYWEQSDNQEQQYTSLSDKLLFNSAQNEEIWNIVMRDSSVLFQSFGKIYEYDYKTVKEIIPPFSISLISKVDGILYLQVNGKGLMTLSPQNEFKLIDDHPQFTKFSLKFVLPHVGDQLLIGTSDGLFTYKSKKLTRWNENNRSLFGNDQLNKAIVLEKNKYCIGTITNGLFIADSLGNIQMHINKSNGLSSNNVLSILKDKDQNIWVSSNLGLDLVEMNHKLTYFKDFSGIYGSAFCGKVINDKIYIGTNQGLFSSPWNNKEPLNLNLIPGTEGLVWELEIFNNQLLCGHNRGTLIVQGDSAELISNISGGRAFTSINNSDNPSHHLIQGSYSGLVLFEFIEGKWNIKNTIAGLTTVIHAIEQGQEEGMFWVANPYQGIYKIKLNDDLDSLTYLKSYGAKDGLPSIYQLELMKIEGRLCVLSDEKLFVYHPEQDQFELDNRIGLQDSSSGKTISALNDSLYIVFQKQLAMLFQNGKLVNENLFFSDISNTNLSYLDSDLILINEGNEFNIWDFSQPKPTIYDDLKISIDKICYSKNNLLEMDCVKADEGNHKIKAKSRYVVRFEYALPIFNFSPKYRYRLKGFDEKWSAWTRSGVKEYTNLSKGKYTFEVENDFNKSLATFDFEIRPFWYQSIFFFIGLIILLSFLIRQFYVTKLKNEMRRMEIQKNRELQRQKLTLRNTQLQNDVEAKKIELANYAGSLVRKNDVLQKIKQELQENEVVNISKLSHKLNRVIDQHLSSEEDWKKFETSFNEIHDEFFKRLKHDFPELMPGDMKLAAYLKMNLTSKEIASLMNITIRGIENKRYRLRKKMHLSSSDNLVERLLTF